jgi:hypothetical protein
VPCLAFLCCILFGISFPHSFLLLPHFLSSSLPLPAASTMVPPDPVPGLYLLPLDDSFFPPKRIALPPGTRVRIGRQLNQKSAPGAGNGVFESRVLSRQHAEAWIEGGRVRVLNILPEFSMTTDMIFLFDRCSSGMSSPPMGRL